MAFLTADGSDASLPPEEQAAQIKAIYPIVKGQKSTLESSPANSPAQNPQDGGPDVETKTGADLSTPKPPSDAVETILASTGKQTDGPLIDFADDLKKDLPADKSAPNNGQG